MQALATGFCAAVLIFALPWPGGSALPAWLAWAGAALGVAGLGMPGHPLSARRAATLGAAIGLMWGGAANHRALDARLPVEADGSGARVSARVVTRPELLVGAPQSQAERSPAVRFEAVVVGAPAEASDRLLGARVRLSWYGAPELRQGETWRLDAVLRGPWSYANPGGFDYERWLLGNGIQGTGWVRGGTRAAADEPGRLDRWREHIAAAVETAGVEHPGVLLALLLGRGDAVDDELWEIFRATGTVHLMVISGLHVSLVAALGFFVGRLGVRACPPLLLWLDARRGGCVGGAAAAVAYVALAGGELPALRALVMAAATLALLAWSRRSRPAALLLLALSVLLIAEPLAVHRQGFWLSFAAVALLLLVLGPTRGGRSRVARASRLVAAQLALSIGMLPFIAVVTGTVPWTGLPANLVAVPLMSLGVVPLCLLAALLLPVSAAGFVLLLHLADCLLAVVLLWLNALAELPASFAVGTGTLWLVCQAACLALLAGAPRRCWPPLLLCVALPLAPARTGVPSQSYRITALDVGQGTAIVVDTRRHRLLYDAGPGYPSGFEAGSAVVVPSLAVTGPLSLDALVLSHDDSDHTGGAPSVTEAASPRSVWRGWDHATAACHGRAWRWDGVTFRLLDIPRPAAAPDNDRSCVLLVDDGRRRALLAGDISAAVEYRLLRRLAQAGPASDVPLTLMFAPHHGSASSSSRALVRLLEPRVVFVSAARGNRFGHPHPEVVDRYREVGARIYRTGWDGALIWRSDQPQTVLRWRYQRLPYWRAAVATE